MVELFQGELLGLLRGSAGAKDRSCRATDLGEYQEQHDEGDRVEASVEAERARGSKSTEKARESESENRAEEVGDGDSPSDALFTLRQREHLGGVHVPDRQQWSFLEARI